MTPNPTLRPATLSLALAIALASSPLRAEPQPSPHWPLVGERSEQITPLRAIRDGWRRAAMQRDQARARPATTLAVANCDDDGSAGSLRVLLDEAVDGDTVDLTALTCSTITLTDGVLVTHADDLHVVGPTSHRITIDGNAQDRVLLHFATGTLTIENLDIANGYYAATGTDIGYAAGIGSAGNVTLINSTVRDNVAVGVGSYGGGIVSDLLTMRNSTITGNVANGHHPTNTTAAYGGGAFVYEVDIADSTISGNIAKGTHNPPLTHWEIGGGIFIAGGGRIERSTISDNLAYLYGGGLANEDDITIVNSTISGNTARQGTGGGLRIRRFTSLTLENSTVADNTAGTVGGGIFFAEQAYASTLRSSLVADNSSPDSADIGSAQALTISGSNNLVEVPGATLILPADTLSGDPLLRPLADNGGPTLTHALVPGSPAIDHGSNDLALTSDQRGPGFPRSANGGVDIGAWENSALPYSAPQPVPATNAAGRWLLGLLAIVVAGLALRGHGKKPRRTPA